MDKVAIIDKGRIMALGKPSDLKSDFGNDLVEVTVKVPGGGSIDDQLKSKLKSMELGSESSFMDRTLRVAVAEGRKALPTVLHKIESLGVEVESISVRTPSLDDVFIKYTGRGIREEGEGGEDTSDTRKRVAKVIGKMRQRV
jgi:ABC-2 type transport system ATP-binding protein